jgi:hypothetical protein
VAQSGSRLGRVPGPNHGDSTRASAGFVESTGRAQPRIRKVAFHCVSTMKIGCNATGLLFGRPIFWYVGRVAFILPRYSPRRAGNSPRSISTPFPERRSSRTPIRFHMRKSLLRNAGSDVSVSGHPSSKPRNFGHTCNPNERCSMSRQTQYWFPAKRYGWGWGFPDTWQGRMVIALYVALTGAGAVVISPSIRPAFFVAYLVFLSCLLIAVCWAKGEPPRWRWGKRDGT